jgi:hypothetical protein
MILQSDASQGGNARFGTAVYLTQKTPELPRKAIYLNNYDDRLNILFVVESLVSKFFIFSNFCSNYNFHSG